MEEKRRWRDLKRKKWSKSAQLLYTPTHVAFLFIQWQISYNAYDDDLSLGSPGI